MSAHLEVIAFGSQAPGILPAGISVQGTA